VVIGDVLDNQGQALAGELGPAAWFLGPRRRSRPEARRLARPGQQRRNLPAGRADGDRRRALAAAHPDQPVRLLPRHEGMKAVVPAMERSGGGSIVNISSVAGLKGSPGSFAYAATKWALRGMTKSAAIV
jgi:3alpha(or 20beta)-hydroxysteroid dehydrogenase